MGAYGLRPVVEIQFADYIYPAYDQLVSEAARLRYRSAGDFTAPMTVRTPYGGGIFGGQTHSQSPEAMFTHVAGLKTVIPSTPYDAKGLLISAIEDDDPVIFLEPKRIYNGPFDGHHDRPVHAVVEAPGSEVPEGHYTVPLGKADIVRAGGDAHRACLRHHGACGAGRGRRSRHRRRGDRSAHPVPVDIETIVASVKKTGRCVIVHEATRTSGYRRRAVGAGAGALFLSSRSADRARDRLGHALSARLRVGVFPGTGARHRGDAPRDGGLTRWAVTFSSCPMSAKAPPKPRSSPGTSRSAIVIEEDQNLVDVMTDKATVEMTSPVAGKVVVAARRAGRDGAGRRAAGRVRSRRRRQCKPATAKRGGESRRRAKPERPKAEAKPAPKPAPAAKPGARKPPLPAQQPAAAARRVAASTLRDRRRSRWPRPPCASARTSWASICNSCRGTGPGGRITHEDLDAFVAAGGASRRCGGAAARDASATASRTVKVIGLRRKIAEKMQDAKRRIPHFAYVEEIDLTELEDLRAHLNATKRARSAQAHAAAVPHARAGAGAAGFSADQRALRRRGRRRASLTTPSHIGIATQTANGLIVPVVRHAEARDVWDCAAEVARLAAAARDNKASSDELSGSTITITSLGALGGIVTTPVINHPEVAIIGANKIVERPVVKDGQIVVRKMMNLSSSFDHRVVDGYDAARFIQRVKALLEHPAALFMD